MMKSMFFRLMLVVYTFFVATMHAQASVIPSAVAPLPGYFSHGVIDLRKSVTAAQDSFEETYVRTLLNNEKFFDDAYNNNLVLTSEIDWNFAQNGLVFMKLIDFLEKKEGSEAELMLTKLNELFYLLFHRHLSHLDLPREKQVEAVRSLHYLFNFKDAAGKGILRSNLTRILIYTMMVETLGLHYYEKKEIVFFALEDFRAALKYGASSVANNSDALSGIELLIDILAAYGMKEPIIKPRNFKKWAIICIVPATIGAVCYYYDLHKEPWNKLSTALNELVESLAKTFSKSTKDVLVDPAVDRLMEKLEERGPVLGEQLADGMVRGLAYEDVDAEEVDPAVKRPNRKTAKLGEMLGDGMVRGLAYEDVDAEEINPAVKRPNRKTRELGRMLGSDLGDAIKDKAAELGTELGEGMLEGLVNENPKRKVPAGRRPNRNAKKLVRGLVDEAVLRAGDRLEDADIAVTLPMVGRKKLEIKTRAERREAARKAAEGADTEEDEGGAEEEIPAPPRGGARPRRGRSAAKPTEEPARAADESAPRRGGRRKPPADRDDREEDPKRARRTRSRKTADEPASGREEGAARDGSKDRHADTSGEKEAPSHGEEGVDGDSSAKAPGDDKEAGEPPVPGGLMGGLGVRLAGLFGRKA